MAKLHTFRDDFNDNAINLTLWSPGGPVSEVGGRLECRPSSGGWATCYGNLVYDLTDSSITLEAVQVTGVWAYMNVLFEGSYQSLEISTYNDEWILAKHGDSSGWHVYAEIPYDPVAHRWWRIRERDGTTYWEVSSEGFSWTVLASAPNPVPVERMSVKIGGEASPVRGWRSTTT